MQQLIMGSQSGKKTEDRNQCFHTDVVAGEKLKRMAADVQALETRDCFTFLQKYINGKSYGKVCILYGLRHTGKTTLLFQSIAALIEAEMKKAVYIRIRATDTMDNLNKDMQLLDMMGYRYYFIDEVTLMEDFIDSASLLSDIHAMSGSKVILSGAESLCFWFTLNNELYDRAYTLHTTHIPYREYSRVLDIHDIDTYIRYGGTMKASGSCTEEEVFRDEKSAENYIREAICRNIRHSLACCRERKMHHLCSLYETGQLNDAGFRVIENMNYRFLLHVLMHRLQPCGHASAKACRQPQCQEIQTDILMQIDQKAMIRKLMVMLEMRIQECRQDTMTDIHMKEIKGYLKAMDLIVDCPSESIDGSNVPEEYVLFTQLGVRYCLVQAMVHALLNEPVFQAFSKQEKKLAADRILEEVKGQMLADIVLLETSGCLPKDDKAFRLFFSKGETDMVIYHAVEDVCEIYEIRHGNRIDNDAYYAL
ncbi:MAG: ATP-binding protein [Solobacterium sp.]|nr:ATP-binding protein [Solobacterium sp.]